MAPDIHDAARAFRAFFAELNDAFLERETLLRQIQLALLAREHVLVTGPPGTAKSSLASAVLSRIHDETTGRPSLFAKQISELTVQTDLIGAVDFKVLTETGRTEYLTDDGMLGATHAFLDEVFDGRDMLLRSILNVLHERELKHGRKITPGRTETVIMTSNRYLSEVLARSPDLLLAFADRLSFVSFVPKSFARTNSRAAMLTRASTKQRIDLHARLSLQQLDVLQQAVEQVRVPAERMEQLEALADALERELLKSVARLQDYVPTKYFSQRALVKALWALKAAVVLDAIDAHPERPLEATWTDLEALRTFFLLGGPPREELETLVQNVADPRERAQLEILRLEHRAFDAALAAVKLQTSGIAAEAKSVDAAGLIAKAEALGKTWSAVKAEELARTLLGRLRPGPRHPKNRDGLLAAARTLLSAVEVRVRTGVAAEREASGNLAQLQALSAAYVLARDVTELSSHLAVLAPGALAFASRVIDSIALVADGTQFDGTLGPEQLVSFAGELNGELSAVRSLSALVEDAGAALAHAAGAEVGATSNLRSSEGFAERAPGAGASSASVGVESLRARENSSSVAGISLPSAGGAAVLTNDNQSPATGASSLNAGGTTVRTSDNRSPAPGVSSPHAGGSTVRTSDNRARPTGVSSPTTMPTNGDSAPVSVVSSLRARASELQSAELAVRDRLASALRRRVEATFRSSRGQTPKLDEALSRDAAGLARLEDALVKLSPSARGLKTAMLAALAKDYAQEVLRLSEFARLDQFAAAINHVSERLRLEGIAPEPVLAECGVTVSSRVEKHAQALAQAASAIRVDKSTALTGEAFDKYRQTLVARPVDGEFRGVVGLEAAASLVLAAHLKQAVATAELDALDARVRYISAWLSNVVDAYPPSGFTSRDAGERAFDALVRSRLPQLVLKEGELLRIEAALSAFAGTEATIAQRAQSLGEAAKNVSNDFAAFSRAVLDARAKV